MYVFFGHVFFLPTSGPVLVDIGFVLELLGQVVKTLKTHHLTQQPFFERLLGDLQALPSSSDVLEIDMIDFSFCQILIRFKTLELYYLRCIWYFSSYFNTAPNSTV